MKGKIVFEFSDEEAEDIETAVALFKVKDYWLCLWDMADYLRGKLKYEDLPEDIYDCLEKTQDKLFEIMNNRGVSLDDHS